MVLYRICNCKHADDVSGTGAKLFGGRWNSVGVPMHYMAATRALAALEVLANKSTMPNALNLCLTVFEVPEGHMETLKVQDLPKNWRQYPSDDPIKKIGDDFVKRQKALLLAVPSAIIADEYNYLMNVQHPLAASLKIIEIKPFTFDERLA